jgi:hypothetical protein
MTVSTNTDRSIAKRHICGSYVHSVCTFHAFAALEMRQFWNLVVTATLSWVAVAAHSLSLSITRCKECMNVCHSKHCQLQVRTSLCCC